jgi:hypothetical protein
MADLVILCVGSAPLGEFIKLVQLFENTPRFRVCFIVNILFLLFPC